MAVVSGVSVNKIPGSNSLVSGDLLLVATPTDHKCMFHDNAHVMYADMRDQMIERLSSEYQFGSMAYCDENAYSKADHGHDAEYDRVVMDTKCTDGIHVASFFSRSKLGGGVDQTDVCLYTYQYEYDSPLIGELKFVTDTSPRNIAVDSEEFDGWVYADGSSYSSEKFPSASETFGTPGSSTFNVPLLQEIPRGCATNLEVASYRAGTEVTPVHCHDSNMVFDSRVITGEISVLTVNPATQGTASHTFSGNKTYKIKDLPLKITEISFPTTQA